MEKTVKSKEAKPKAKDGQVVPKHRFDCVNLAFKETKEALFKSVEQADRLSKRVLELETELAESKEDLVNMARVMAKLTNLNGGAKQ